MHAILAVAAYLILACALGIVALFTDKPDPRDRGDD
jgi:hypothetical protein